MSNEEKFSPSMMSQDCWGIASVPMCNGCKLWHRGKHSCNPDFLTKYFYFKNSMNHKVDIRRQ